MDEERKRGLYREWIRATALGWLLGLLLVVLLAMGWDLVGGGAQFPVGLGMGAGVGWMQGRVARAWAGGTRPWLLATVLGLGIPFLLWDILALAGVELPFALPACVLLGGLLAGLLQQRLLRPHFPQHSRWVAASVAGWGLPAVLLALGDSGFLPGGFGFLPPLVIFLGGLLPGAVSGKAFDWISREDRGTPSPGVA